MTFSARNSISVLLRLHQHYQFNSHIVEKYFNRYGQIIKLTGEEGPKSAQSPIFRLAAR